MAELQRYLPKSKVVVAGVVEGEKDGRLLLKARQVTLLAPPTWEKYYYPVPREWYPPELEYWYTPPYFDPYRGGAALLVICFLFSYADEVGREDPCRLTRYEFGRHRASRGRPSKNDVLIWPGRIKSDWWRQEAHFLQLDDVAEALAVNPQVRVVGQGEPGKMQGTRPWWLTSRTGGWS